MHARIAVIIFAMYKEWDTSYTIYIGHHMPKIPILNFFIIYILANEQ